ncbi:putative Transcription initiation factor TFIID subunit 5 [Paratrimastix pyriformis]|uniref:Transcription initiation factor TFIID subunit 5 n=1 Tax=Paratrimastix pyriformis TaxID=342808 RepID=A0ABQ8UMF0_9EUKA|nr:putative Transcription initiation factor TFIID subunit 5 [Paratrimastix pyriformis]
MDLVGPPAPEEYLKAVQDISEWAYSSLELFRGELLAVLYPVLVHSYLELVKRGFEADAQTLLRRFRHHHDLHQEEIERLLAARTPQLIDDSPLATIFLQHKYIISMSQDTAQLLFRHLHDNHRLLILSLLNQHVDLQTYSGQPRPSADRPADVGITGMEGLGIKALNRRPIQWGVLPPPAEASAAPAVGADDDQGTKRARMGKGKEEEGGAGTRLPPAPSSSEHPIPQYSQGVLTEAYIAEDLRRQVSLSGPALPSVCFFTFFNLHSSLNGLEFAADGSLMMSANGDSSVQTWDFLPERVFYQADPAQAAAIAASPLHQPFPAPQAAAEHHAAAGAGAAPLPPAAVAAQPRPYPSLHSESPHAHHQIYWGHSGPVHRAVLSNDGQFALSCSEDGSARLWSLEAKTAIASYRGHQSPLWDCAFAPANYYFATCGHDRTARLWATDRLTPLRLFAGHVSDVDCLCFHPNSLYLATGSSDRSVRLWDLHEGPFVRTFVAKLHGTAIAHLRMVAGLGLLGPGHTAAVTQVVISPDGRTLASSDMSGSIRLWDLALGQQLAHLQGHTKAVWSLSFSQDSALLASGGADNTVRLWDMSKVIPGEEDPAPASMLPSASTKAAASALVKTLNTKWTPVLSVRFTRRNVLLAGGPFRPPAGLTLPPEIAAAAGAAPAQPQQQQPRLSVTGLG